MYLSRFELAESEAQSVASIPALAASAVLSDQFLGDGFDTFLADPRSIADRLADFLPGFIGRSGIDPARIGTAILVSDSLGQEAPTATCHTPMIVLRNVFFETLAKSGVIGACTMLVGGAGCANLAQALETGAARLSGPDHTDQVVLVVFADRFMDLDKRVMPLVQTARTSAGTIGSDVLAACILSSQRPEGGRALVIGGLHRCDHLPMIPAYEHLSRTGDSTGYMLETVKGLARFKRAAVDRLGQPMSAFSRVFAGNYTAGYFKIYQIQFGWTADQIDMGTKARLAHLQSLDGLVSAWRQAPPIENALIFLIGPAMWAAIRFSTA